MVVEIPERIGRLKELAGNLWWSWHEQARHLFRTLDYTSWRLSVHNAAKELHEVSQETFQAAAADPAFLSLYDSVMAEFDREMSTQDTWVARHYPDMVDGPVAYFSMEYAIHNSLPIYAGGLGILAGDTCKGASDLGLRMAAVGFMYPQGYFHQHINQDGWQQEIYRQLDFAEAPISRLQANGSDSIARVRFGQTSIGIGVWQVRAGTTNIYLLDTNLAENPEEFRNLSARLYIADRELRIQQEIVLGIGGVRVLRALGVKPAVWHANEGHNAFMALELIREKVAQGIDFDSAMGQVQSMTSFTTHTPVLAGHDVFPNNLVVRYFTGYWDELGIDREKFLDLGQYSPSGRESFNMTALAMRTASHRNAVSELHGKVTRRMWNGLWPDLTEDKVPITHITNGVHVPSWLAPELAELYHEYCGKNWDAESSACIAERIIEIPSERLWAVHQQLKRKLVSAIHERMRDRWVADDVPWCQMLAMGALLDPDILTIAFARRFVEYKRPALLFTDIERLKRIANDRLRPVQFVFAGKSHPADFASKCLLQQVYRLAAERDFQGRIIFIEDYDMHMARYLVQGVDVWLNTPRRLQEASGTSGMKAAINGVPQISVLDGWWREGYNGVNGWAIGQYSKPTTAQEEDKADAESLYELLEKTIIPLYYKQDRNGVPPGWMSVVKEAISSIMPAFSSERMLTNYIERVYLPIVQPQSLSKSGR